MVSATRGASATARVVISHKELLCFYTRFMVKFYKIVWSVYQKQTTKKISVNS
jgi:hypothetical protein